MLACLQKRQARLIVSRFYAWAIRGMIGMPRVEFATFATETAAKPAGSARRPARGRPAERTCQPECRACARSSASSWSRRIRGRPRGSRRCSTIFSATATRATGSSDPAPGRRAHAEEPARSLSRRRWARRRSRQIEIVRSGCKGRSSCSRAQPDHRCGSASRRRPARRTTSRWMT